MKYLEKLFNVKGKVVVITGAKGLLGSALVGAFSQAGADVVGLDVDEVDITRKAEVIRAVELTLSTYGHMDVLINNAGVSDYSPMVSRCETMVDWMMGVNLKGTFNCIQSYVNELDRRFIKGGNIINIASVYGLISPDFDIYPQAHGRYKGGEVNSEIYGATKAGIIQMTKWFAVYLADRKIRVNAISPGGILNKQDKCFEGKYSARVPMKRMANVEEIIGAAIYLASEASSYVTGTNLIIDGGLSAK